MVSPETVQSKLPANCLKSNVQAGFALVSQRPKAPILRPQLATTPTCQGFRWLSLCSHCSLDGVTQETQHISDGSFCEHAMHACALDVHVHTRKRVMNNCNGNCWGQIFKTRCCYAFQLFTSKWKEKTTLNISLYYYTKHLSCSLRTLLIKLNYDILRISCEISVICFSVLRVARFDHSCVNS